MSSKNRGIQRLKKQKFGNKKYNSPNKPQRQTPKQSNEQKKRRQKKKNLGNNYSRYEEHEMDESMVQLELTERRMDKAITAKEDLNSILGNTEDDFNDFNIEFDVDEHYFENSVGETDIDDFLKQTQENDESNNDYKSEMRDTDKIN